MSESDSTEPRSAPRQIRGRTDSPDGRFAIVVSRFNELISERLAEGAEACLRQHGVAARAIDRISVPGAWELPFAAREAAKRGGYAAIIAIGCVIRGETPHFDFVAGGAANGLAAVSLDTGVPVTFGLLTTNDEAQAVARAGGEHGNKGWEAALAALEMVDLKGRIGAHRAGT
jgi:6,7-dimethyl-8-ribityllumazine synthase